MVLSRESSSYLPYEGLQRKPPFPIFGEGGFPASAVPDGRGGPRKKLLRVFRKFSESFKLSAL